MLDVIVAAAVEQPPLATPPTTPAIGDCYIVGASPTGAWSGHAQQVAAFTSGGWRFVAPRDGLNAFVRSSGQVGVYSAGAWVVGTLRGSQVAQRRPGGGPESGAIANPSGGSTTNTQARSAIGQILTALRGHGLIAP